MFHRPPGHSQVLHRLDDYKIVALLYVNVNSVRSKFENLREIIKQNLDVLAVEETKIDASFLSAQFLLEGYHTP